MQQRDLPAIFRQAVADHRAGRLAAAEAGYRRILAVQPNHADSLHYLGLIAAQLGRHDLAVELIGRAVAVRPGMADYLNNLGLSLLALARPAEAAEAHRQATTSAPDMAEAHNNLGNALRALDRPAEAEARYRQALALAPDMVAAHNNLGAALTDLDRLDEAEASYRAALARWPDYPEAHNNLGNTLRALGRWAEATAAYRQAIALAPDYPEAHYNLGWSLLLAGDFAEGWVEFDWRWRIAGGQVARNLPAPLWTGEPLEGRTLLLHCEQGAGDTFLFVRYVALAAQRGRVVLEAPAPLVGLLARIPGLAGIVPTGAALPSFELHCPLLNLPRVFDTVLSTIPAAVPYLTADPARVAAWRDRLQGLEGRRIGLVWAGNPAQRDDRRRSIALAALAPLATVPGVSFVSLQKGRRAAAPDGMHLVDWTDELIDYDDTAALITALDLVISVDTGVAHLAGALGRPVWVMNRFEPYFAWLAHGADSPWYPSLRQFRQTAPGNWTDVIESVRAALAAVP